MEGSKPFDVAAAERAIGHGRPRVIDCIRRAYAAKAQPFTTSFIDSDGQPIVLYFAPLTMADVEAIRLMKGDSTMSPIDEDLKMLVMKARQADGTPAFMDTDIPLLKTESHFAAIREMVTFMWSIGAVSHAEAKDALKN